MMSAMDLVDIWRIKNPDLIRYTWQRNSMASKIDFFLTSFSLISKVNQVLIAERFCSDHHLIISILLKVTGGSYWKFNQSLLEDETFILITKTFIIEYFSININSRKSTHCVGCFSLFVYSCYRNISNKNKK